MTKGKIVQVMGPVVDVEFKSKEELPYINIVSFAGPEASNAGFKNLPYDGEGKWAWADYSHVEKAN